MNLSWIEDESGESECVSGLHRGKMKSTVSDHGMGLY